MNKVGHSGFTFEGRGHRLGGAEGVCVGERTLAGVADGLYSEAVTAGLGQPLDFVGVARTTVDGHKPAGRETQTRHNESKEFCALRIRCLDCK